MSWIAVGVTAVATGAKIYSDVKAADYAGDARSAERRQQRVQAWVDAMQNIKEVQMAQAVAGTAWQGSGADLESSGAMGVASSVGSQGAFNLSILQENVRNANAYYEATAKASKWQGIGNFAGSIANISSMFIGMGGAPGSSPSNPVSIPNKPGNYGVTFGSSAPAPQLNTQPYTKGGLPGP